MMAHEPLARNVDKAIAGLLQDLRLRGLLEDTLVVWTSEFGRTPFNAAADARGREHHHWVYSSWIAGAGVRAGSVYGASDDYGIDVGQDPVHLHDFHATLLHLMGLDHERLTFRHNGRDHRLTDVAGNVVQGLLA
jgi:arylsulfatase A-like enzyme